jgi:hypothetical protein
VEGFDWADNATGTSEQNEEGLELKAAEEES